MKCIEREQLFGYAQGMLEPDEEREVRAHLVECALCRGVVDEFQGVEKVLDEWEPLAPSPWFDTRVRAAIASAGRPHRHWAWFGLGWLPWLSPIMLGALAVIVSVTFFSVRRSHNHAHLVPQQSISVLKQSVVPGAQPEQTNTAEDELVMYENLPVLEDNDYDLLANFDLLSDLPRGEKKVMN